MSAVISGNGLGLFNSSFDRLGGGLGSGGQIGQGRDGQYINIATGNLVLQSRDEQLLFRGLSIAHLRTYNSLGTSSEVGTDGWLTGYERNVELLSGSFNAVGSIMRRHTGDGSYQDFSYVADNTYVSTAGEGAHDSLTWFGSTREWAYVEGSSRRQEAYADHADAVLRGRLTQIADLRSDGSDPAVWSISYDAAGRIQEVATVGGNALVFAYDAEGRLAAISTREAGILQGQVKYGYDGAGRLSTVLLDLTPEDGTDDTWDGTTAGNNDGRLFRTVYTYVDEASLRISQVTQSDGTLVSYTYDASGRISTVTRGDINSNDADGAGNTLNFSYDVAARSTHVSDSSGRTWTYVYASSGLLIQVHAPALEGLRDVTSYTYDAAGNLTHTSTVRGGKVLSRSDYQYDADGNLLWQWDLLAPAAGTSATAVRRTYTANNQLASETRYIDLDPDGMGSGQEPSNGLTTRYVYDAQDRLRFVVAADGAVSEVEYYSSGSGVGQESKARQYLGDRYASTDFTLDVLTGWATDARKSNSTLFESSYDLNGRLAMTKSFSSVNGVGAGVEDDATEINHFVYDAQGLLREKATLRSSTETVNDGRDRVEATTYVYDGIGRLLSEVVTQTVGGTPVTLRTTVWSHLDSVGSLRTIIEGGIANDGRTANDLMRTEVRNAAGQIITVTESAVSGGGGTRTTQHYYDATGRLRATEDAQGGRHYTFYDAKGEVSAQVDATGALTQFVRDGRGTIVETLLYGIRLNSSDWLVDGVVSQETVDIPTTDPDLRRTVRTYDGAGRIASQTDAEGMVSTYSYDGAGRLVQIRVTDAAGDAATARVERYFHDGVGRQVGTLDAGGFLTEYKYDNGGRQIATIRYASASPSTLHATGTLDQLRPASNAADQITRHFHDGRDQLIAELDAEGYLTEYIYDQARNQRAVKAYARQITGLTGTESLAALRAFAQGDVVRETRRSFDALGRVIAEQNSEGTLTRYSYDAAGRLLKTESAAGTSELREGHRRYDVFGNLVGELGGEGSTHILGGMTEAQLDAVYAQHGVRHAYDALGQRVESVDSEGNKTWYFYDSVGRMTHTVRGVADAQGVANAAGEVTETRYTAFGEVRDEIAYTGRIAIGSPFGREQVAAAIQVLHYVAAQDSRVQYAYDRRGHVTERLDAEGYTSSWRYTAFGDLHEQIEETGVSSNVTTRYTYDSRGLLTSQVDDVSGLARATTRSHDAFGRVTTATDALGSTVTFTYDRLGRQIADSRVVSGRTEALQTAYDAFDRALKHTDALGQVTTYFYDDVARSVRVTTPEGVVLTTQRNLHGESWRVVDGLGNSTQYHYNNDGQLVRTVAADGGEFVRDYDARGLLTITVDETGRKTEYRYDAAGRVLQRIEDPEGLALKTSYAYDGQGRELSVTDGTGLRTTMAYDGKGQLTGVVRDPEGLALKTTYVWDARGNRLEVVEGAGTAAATRTTYVYDALGRRISETIDPGTGKLNLKTTYSYDNNDNITSSTDAEGRITRFAYDEANRRVFSVDGQGGVVQFWYDPSGRVVATRSYAQAINLSGVPEAITASAVQALVTINHTRDVQQYHLYDRDGRLHLSIDGAGAVTEFGYDAVGRKVRSTRYADTTSLTTALRNQLQAGVATAAAVLSAVTANALSDHSTFSVFDTLGRLRFSVDYNGTVIEQRYDLAGRASQTLSYANPLGLSAAERSALADGTMSVGVLAARMASQADAARAEYLVFDGAGRARYSVERSGAGVGVVTERVHDAAGRLIAARQFGTTVVFDPGQDVATLAAALPPSDAMRHTRYVYDSAGRMRFTLAPAGMLTETRYDATGRVTQALVYGELPVIGAKTEAALEAWTQTQPAADIRITSNTYDSAGRLQIRTDALGKVERYSYDGSGLVTAYTDRNGYIWNYEYDAAGRQVKETSPQVVVATVNAAGAVTTASKRLVTATTYDALGNVTGRTKNAGTTEARLTQYVYDNRGNQIRTIFPDAWKINESSGELEATGSTPTIEVSYDALGRAVVQKDVRGHYSYKVYDTLGRVAFEVDQEGFVTSYAYNAFGEQGDLRRHSTRINTSGLAGWLAGQPLTLAHLQQSGVLATTASDRTLSTTYDQRGNKLRVVQSQVEYYNAAGSKLTDTPTTQFSYNAYGDLVRESVLLEGAADLSTARWAHTYRYFDALGRMTFVVDAEGYATTTTYSATGEVLETVEHARALNPDLLDTSTPPAAPAAGNAIIGFDRITRWEYDALGRKAMESVVRQYSHADGSAGVRDINTVFGYDNEGHATTVTTEAGITTTRYDALGRVLSLQEPARATLTASAEASLLASTTIDLSAAGLYESVSPYTALVYDAFGNVVQTRRYANGVKEGQSAPVANAGRDQIHVTRYDRQGRAVMTKDAEGNLVYSAFDAADNIEHTWSRLSGSTSSRDVMVHGRYQYDKVGRQVSTIQSRQLLSGGAAVEDLSEVVTYNGFGEIATKTFAGLGGTLTYGYDAAGRLLTSNDGGTTHTFSYNLAGHAARQSHKASLAPTQVVDAVSWSITDRLGRTITARLPSHDASTNEVVVTQQLDRWGNVLQVIDGRGYQTNYQYNAFNQIVRDERPLVYVVSDTGVGSWIRPVNHWRYDAFGRLVATEDANGNIRASEYDAVGRLIRSIDALQNATIHAYDAMGNQQISQNPLGYLTFKNYDRLNRVVAIGDYLRGSSGATRQKTFLQRYELNENGGRRVVTDALGHSALYDYDSRNLLLRSQTTMGVVVDYGYDVQGHKTRETNGLVGTSTIIDRDGEAVRLHEQTWDYDVHGRVIDHNNLGTRDYDYTYHSTTGQLTAESSAGGAGMPGVASKAISYFANGQIREVVETGNAATYRYEYDAAGNRTSEETITTDGTGGVVHTVTRTWYDSNNRIQRVVQDDLSSGSAKRVFGITYEYDAVGNRRHVRVFSGYGPNVDEVPVAPSLTDQVAEAGVPWTFIIPEFADLGGRGITYTVSGLPSWMSFDAASRRLSGTPRLIGSWTITVVVDDGIASSSTSFLVTTPNAAPIVINPIGSQSAGRNMAWSYTVPADTFSDSNGDVLTYTASGMPAGVSFDTTTRRFSGTPNVLGSHTITVTAKDPLGATRSTSFILNVANNPPTYTAGSLPARTPNLLQPVSWSLPAGSFTDPNGDQLSYSLMVLVPGHNERYWFAPDAAYYTRWVPAEWVNASVVGLNINANTGVITGTASYHYVPRGEGLQSEMLSSYTVKVVATDGSQASAEGAFGVTLNLPPTASGGWISAGINVPLSYQVTGFSDPEGGSLTYTASLVGGGALPSWLSFSASGKFSGTAPAAGTWEITVTARDNQGLTSSAPYTLKAGNSSPVYVAGTIQSTLNAAATEAYSYQVPAGAFVDPNGDSLSYSAYLAVWREGWTDGEGMWNPGYWENEALPSWLTFNSSTRTLSGTPLAEGSYQINFVAKDPGNAIAQFRTSLVVGPQPNYIPVAPVLTNKTVARNTSWSYQIPVFTDANGDTLTYTSSALPAGVTFNAATRTFGGKPTVQGTYTLTITANDGRGGTANASFTLSVDNTAPTAPTIENQTATAGTSWGFAIPAFSDSNNDSLTYTVSGLPSWMSFNVTTRTLSGSPKLVGSWTITVVASDGQAETSRSFVVTTPNAAPIVVNAVGSQSANRNMAWSYTVPADTFSDPNGDALTYTASGMPAGVSFDTATRRFSGTPNVLGSHTITVTAKDPLGATRSTSFILNVANNPPTYTAGSLPARTPNLLQPVSWSLPAGSFTDPNGDQLSYSLMVLVPGHNERYWFAPDAAYYTRWVPDEWVSASVVGLSINANTGVITGAASYHYVPRGEGLQSDMLSSYTVKVVATDGSQASAEGAFGVTLNLPPTASGGWISAGINVPLSYQVTGFSDPEGGSLIYTASLVGGGALPSWLSFSASGKFSGTAPAAGTWEITVTARDNQGLTSSAPYTLKAGNSSPVYVAGTIQSTLNAAATVAYSYQVPAGAFVDPNGDSLSYSAYLAVWREGWTDGEGMWNPGYWENEALPSWLTFNSSTRTLSGTPLAEGSYQINFVAKDPGNAIAQFRTSLVVGPQPNYKPVAPVLTNKTVARNTIWSYQIPVFTDANGDTLTYTSSALPAGVTFNAATRTFGGKPTVQGTYTLTVTANDGRGGTASASFTLSVDNTAPTAPAIANQTATAGTSWGFAIPAFSDSNNDSLTYTVSGLPSWMSFNATTRTLSGSPKAVGSWTITVAASDGQATTSRSFVVTTPNVAPVVANGIGNQSVARNKAWSFTVPANTFSDANGDALTYTASGLPAGVSFDVSSRSFSGAPTVIGSHSITVTANDQRGGTRSTTFVLSVVNTPPVYAGGLVSRTSVQGQNVSWALPAGSFTDANGDALSYSVQVLRPGYTEIYWEPREAAYLPRWVDAVWINVPSLVISATGTITGIPPTFYTPIPPNGGSSSLQPDYSIRIIATDSAGAYATGSFSYHLNVPPSAPSLPNTTIKTSVPVSISLLPFSDLNGDVLTYTASGLPAGLSFNATSRIISGTTTVAGAFTVTITANDGKGGVTSASFTLTVQANTAPTAPSIPNQSATTGTPFSYTVPVFSDANNDPLTYSIAGLPAGLSFTASTRVISGTPTAAGSFTVTVTAKDGRGGTVSKAFTITVVTAAPPNRAPVVNKQPPSPAAHFFSTNRYLVPTSSFRLPVDTFTDPDNNPLTYTVLEKPSWLSYGFSSSSGHSFSGVNNDTRRFATHTIRIRATDSAGASVIVSFTISSEYDYFDPWNPTDPLSIGDPALLSSFTAPDMETGPDAGAGGAPVVPLASGTIPYQVTEQWFTYDAENRLKINNGELVNGQILVKAGYGGDSYELMYDAAGREVARYERLPGISGGTPRDIVYRSAYDLRGNKTLEFHGQVIGQSGSHGGVMRQFSYTATGLLESTRSFYDTGTTMSFYHPQEAANFQLNVGGWLTGAEQYSYDSDGRLLSHVAKDRVDPDWVQLWEEWVNGTGKHQGTDLTVLDDISRTYHSQANGGSGYDAAGRATVYRYSAASMGWATHTYTTAWQGWESYQEQQVTGVSSHTNYKTTTNTLTYDGMGRLRSQREHTNGGLIDDRIRYYAHTGEGQVQLRRAGTITSAGVFAQEEVAGARDNALFVHAAGQQQAELKEGGEVRTWNGGTHQTIQLRSLGGQGHYGAGGGKVTVQAGESLSDLAQRVYGSRQLWYVLADANGLSGPDQEPVAGTQLNAPSVNVNSNDASTFKPYNPNEAIGSTTPSLPYIAPPPRESCNALATVLIVVVAVVVSIATYGAASAHMSAWAAGAMAGASSAAASSAVGSTMGVASFSWRGVAAGAITGAVTAGLGAKFDTVGKALETGQYGKAAALAVANAGANHAAQKLAGMDTSFSWNSIAASAVSSMAAAKVVPGLVGRLGLESDFANDFAHGMTGGMVSAAVRSSFGQTQHKSDYMAVVADAFGNALGNAAARSYNRADQSGRDLMESWEAEDEQLRQQMIAAEEQSRLPSWSSQGGIYDAFVSGYNGYRGDEASSGLPGEVRSDQIGLPDIELAQGGRPGPVLDNPPVLVEALSDDYPRTWTRTVSGGLQRIMTPELQSRYREDQIRYYGERFSRGVFNAVAEPVRMVGDLGKVVYSVAMTEATGRFHEVRMSSGMGRAAEGGATTGEFLQELNPVYGLLVAQHEIRGAIARDDWGLVSEMGGGLAAGLALTRRGSGARTFGAVVDVAEETAALRRIANLNATPEALSLHARINARGIPNNVVPAGSAFEGTLYRAVGEGYDPLLIHPRNVATSHRYTGPGQGGLYFATGRHVVEAEFVNNRASLAGTKMWAFSDQSLPGLLDLSNPSVRNNLGVSLSDLTRTGGTQAWRYEVTQPLGDWAQQTGYRGVIAPSAQADGGVNLILFDPWGVK